LYCCCIQRNHAN